MLKRTAHRLLAWSVVFAMLFSLTVQPAAAADTSGDSSAAVYSAQADESTEAETDPADADSGETEGSADESAASAGEDTGETVEEPADESAEEAQDEAQATVSAAAISEEEDESNATVTASSTVTYDEDGFYTDGDATYYQPAEQNSEGVYEISNAGQLFWFAALVNGDTTQEDITEAVADADAVLTADINLGEREWTPIGNYSSSTSLTYSGTFDGNNCTISGLYINSSSNYQGLFGYVSGGTVKNVTVSGNVTGGSYVGGVCGRNSGTVSGCASTVTVSGKQYVGGAVGYSSGVIKDTAVNATVTGSSSNVGGVVGIISGTNVIGGTSTGSSVEGCSFSGGVTGGTSYTGGIVGQSGSNCSVTTSYNVGSVTGGTSTGTGGIAGMTSATINNCYNSGSVTSGGGDRVGGICGTASSATVTACYNSGLVTNSGSYSGGVCGYVQAGLFGGTYSAFTNCYYDSDVNDSLETVGYYTSSSATLTDVEAKTTAQFASGEVAWLLQNGQEDTSVQVWGQDLNELTTTDYDDLYPVLTSDSTIKVVQITFEAGTGYTLTETPDPCYTDIGQILVEYPYGYAFYLDKACTNELSTETQTYDTDTTVYVQAETFTITFVYPEDAEEGDFTETITVVMFDDEDAKTHDLTQYVPEGYLYGGLYEDAEFTEDTASTQCGAAFYYEEDDDTVYYVKLVDESYFQIKCLLAYERYVPTNLWLVTNIDSDAYASYGFDLLYEDDEPDSLVVTDEATKQLYQKMETNDKTYTGTVDISDFTGFTDEDYDEDDLDRNLVGYFDLSGMVEELLDADAVTFVPFFVTQDGVKVTGTVQRTVSLTNGATSVSGMYSCEDESVASTARSTEEDEDSGSVILLLSTSLRVSATALVTNIEDETATYTITKYDGDTVTTQEVEEGATDVTVEYTEKDGYLFAGWFTDEDYTTAADFSEITGDMTVYAKYVSADYLQVKASTVSSKGVIKSIRMISATDSKNYAEVGFVYQYGDVKSSVEVTKYSTSISGKTAKTLYGGSVVAGSKLIYSDLSVSGMEANTAVTITPYWVTLDGTTVYGTERTITYTGSSIE